MALTMLTPLSVPRATGDLALAARCVAGDTHAQRELFDREFGRVHRTLYRVLGSNAHIDDIVQDVFVAIFRSLGQFRGDASLGTWIDRITVRAAFAHLKARPPRSASLELVEPPSGDVSAEYRAMLREALRRLYIELDKMDAKLRVAFVLHAIDERPVEEVARMMEATVVATKSRIWRARRALEKRARRDSTLTHFVAIRDRREEEPE
jgi:RNA polymerase sigma-70 factor (ECF subfamily)